MGCTSMEKVSTVVINSFNVSRITTNDPEKILYLKNAPDSKTEEIASENELIDNDDETTAIEV